MRRLVCACVVCKPPKTGFLASRPIFKFFNHLLKIASDNFSYLLKMMINLLSHSIYRFLENRTFLFSVCIEPKRLCAKILFQILSLFLRAHFGYLENSVDPDQPASSEAGWSGSTLFFKQLMLCCIIWKEWLVFTCFFGLASKQVLNLIPVGHILAATRQNLSLGGFRQSETQTSLLSYRN